MANPWVDLLTHDRGYGAYQFGVLAVMMLAVSVKGHAYPSRRFLLLLTLPLPVLILAFWWPLLLPLVGIYNILLFLAVLVDCFVLSVPPHLLTLRRSVGRRLLIGEPNWVGFGVENLGHQEVRGFLIDQYPTAFSLVASVEGGQEKTQSTVTLIPDVSGMLLDEQGQKRWITVLPHAEDRLFYGVSPTQRGRFQFGRMAFIYRSFLGLVWIQKHGGRSDSVKVYPALRLIQEKGFRLSVATSLGHLSQEQAGVSGYQFRSLRPYSPGDDFRKIDWKATARRQQPIVKTFSAEVEQPLMILIDGGRKMQGLVQGVSKFDWALNAGLALTAKAVEQGDQVRMAVFDTEIRRLSPRIRDRKELYPLLESIYDVQPRAVEPFYEQIMMDVVKQLPRQSVVIVFSDLIDVFASQSLVQSLQVFSKRHLVILMTMANSHVLDMASQFPDDIRQAYEKGIALDFLQVRAKSLATLKQHGARVIDVPPQGMGRALIEYYNRLKRVGLASGSSI